MIKKEIDNTNLYFNVEEHETAIGKPKGDENGKQR